MPDVSFYKNATAVAARTTEVPDADFTGGLNDGGSCACGIGVNVDGGEVVGTAEQFTLLDQEEAARTPQITQSIGGLAYTDPAGWPSSGGVEGNLPADPLAVGTVSVEGDGITTDIGGATLTTLIAGWVAVVVP